MEQRGGEREWNRGEEEENGTEGRRKRMEQRRGGREWNRGEEEENGTGEWKKGVEQRRGSGGIGGIEQ